MLSALLRFSPSTPRSDRPPKASRPPHPIISTRIAFPFHRSPPRIDLKHASASRRFVAQLLLSRKTRTIFSFEIVLGCSNSSESADLRHDLMAEYARFACVKLSACSYSLFMCGRFARRSTQEVLADWFGVRSKTCPGSRLPSTRRRRAPNRCAPQSRYGQTRIWTRSLGLLPFWAKDAKFATPRLTRGRKKWSPSRLSRSLQERRCLVPADAFYEWQKLDAKTRRRSPLHSDRVNPTPSPDSGNPGSQRREP